MIVVSETVTGKRVLLEVNEGIDVLSLGEDRKFALGRLAFALAQSIAPRVTVLLSSTAVYNDCFMRTFTTLGMDLEKLPW